MIKLKNMMIMFIMFIMFPSLVSAGNKRFEEGTATFGLSYGFGYSINIPERDKQLNLSFLFFNPSYEYNLIGLIGSSWYRGTLNWRPEFEIAIASNKEYESLIGFSPAMFRYKFIDMDKRWAPNILLGVGVAYTDWKDVSQDRLGGEFQFLLHAGVGIEFFNGAGSRSLNYRFFHVSNASSQSPNTGINAHIFSIEYRF